MPLGASRHPCAERAVGAHGGLAGSALPRLCVCATSVFTGTAVASCGGLWRLVGGEATGGKAFHGAFDCAERLIEEGKGIDPSSAAASGGRSRGARGSSFGLFSVAPLLGGS